MGTPEARAIAIFRHRPPPHKGACIRLMRRHGACRYGAVTWRIVKRTK